MKSLTIHQPYTGLIAYGAKTVEVRSKPTKYRGEVLIHAAKGAKDVRQYLKFNHALRDEFDAFVQHLAYRDGFIDIRGAAIAIAEIVHCETFTQEHEGAAFVDVQSVGTAFAWHLANVRLIEPIYYRGQLGLINVDFQPKIIA